MNSLFGIRHHHFTRFVSCGLLYSTFSVSLYGQTAAMEDWARNTKPGQCRGVYVEPQLPAIEKTDEAIRASADSAMHVEGHSTTLTGNIELHHGAEQLKADFLTIDAVSENYTADGNVELRQSGLLLKGDQISGSLFDSTATVDSATFLLHQNRLRGSATSITKDAQNVLTVERGSFTTCEPEENTWAVAGDNITLKTAEGYGVARDVTLRIKDIPVAYFPYFRFPIDDRRQSGFLAPSMGHDSDGGTDLAIPYYFNIRENLDATYTLRSLWRRGAMHEGELRYLSPSTENTLAAAYLPSDDIYDDREFIDAVTPGNFSRQDRWLAHVNHKGRRGAWSSRINYTSVSDIDYLHDLGGFTSTQTDFDRALGQSDSPALLRTGSIRYDQQRWHAQLSLRSFQELNQQQNNQYAVLPRLEVQTRQQLGPARVTGKLQFTEFDHTDNIPEGSRTVIDTRVELPMVNAWGFFNPSIRLVHRDYSLNNTGPGVSNNASITTSLAAIDTGLIFEREVDLKGQSFLQTLEPRLHYLYAEEENQSALPSFDSTPLTPSYESLFRDIRFTGYDRIGDADQVAAGITTNIYAADGRRLFSASIGQLFHLKDRNVNFGITPGIDPTDDTSPLFASLKTSFGRFSIHTAYEFDAANGQSNRGYYGISYRMANNAMFNFHYTMTDAALQRNRQPRNEEESDLSFVWPLSPNWQVIGRWNYGWDDGQTIESLFGLEYNDCCWKARIVFRRNLDEPRLIGLTTPGLPTQFVNDRRADSGIYFEFQLKGLASLGGRLDSLIQDSIPGYFPGSTPP